MQLRKSIQEFAERMEMKLRKNDHKGGWEECSRDYLVSRLREELIEAENSDSGEEAMNEWADVANFAMMLSEYDSEGSTGRINGGATN